MAEQERKARKKELKDGRECVRTVGEKFKLIPSGGLSLSFLYRSL